MGAAAVLLAAGVLTASRKHLRGIDAPEEELTELTDEARAVTVGNET